MNKYYKHILTFIVYLFFVIPSDVFSQELLDRVNRRFDDLKPYGNYELAASIKDGRVKVFGKVSNLEMKEKILNILKNEEGISEIDDSITVDSDFGVEKFSDQYIESHISDLVKDLDSAKNKVSSVEVQNGSVNISGDMESFRVVDDFLSKIRNVHGVKGLKTDITVQGKPYLSNVTKNY